VVSFQIALYKKRTFPLKNIFFIKAWLSMYKLNMDRSCSVSDDIGSSILLRGNKGVRIADFSFNEGHMNSFFAKLFEVQSDLLLVFYNSIHQVICETDF